MIKQKPVVLMILDGFGYREEHEYNAIAQADTPQWDDWWKNKPHILLQASGASVGLPEGQMGNSEVGHMHIGAGREIQQDLTRINNAIANHSFFQNPVLINLIKEVKNKGRTLHILGLLSNGGVHSHENHLFAFLQLCHQHQLQHIALHLFLDGRDTSPKSALSSLKNLHACLQDYPVAQICSLTGRYYAMDRDKRWDRIEPVYRLLTENKSLHHYETADEAVNDYYQQHITDEFIPPTQIGSGKVIESEDAVFIFNFRPDRVRQLTQALISPNFHDFISETRPKLSKVVTMTLYEKSLPTDIAFPPIELHNTLGEVVSKHGMKQLRIAETEKYAHVTFFLNGGKESLFPNEERVLIQSPLVKTYDLRPEMSADELTEKLVAAIESQTYALIICNYANADMVGHTGNFAACIKAIETLDNAMKKVWQALEQVDGQLLITADHGNAEYMFSKENHQPHTAHTCDPVPLVYIGGNLQFNKVTGNLTDIAPTVLRLLGITPPGDMTGSVLLETP